MIPVGQIVDLHDDIFPNIMLTFYTVAGVFHGGGVRNGPSSGQRGGGKPSVAGSPGTRAPSGRCRLPAQAQSRRCALPGDVGRTSVGYCAAGL